MRRVTGYFLIVLGFWRRVTGYFLIVLGFWMAWVFLYFPSLLSNFVPLNYAAFWLLMPILRWPFFFGKRLVAQRATEVRAMDLRAPVLLLRSFADDRKAVKNMPVWSRFLLFRYFVWDYTTFEEMLVRIFSTCGPVVAIGRPGQTIPPLGAAREWVSHPDWQHRVQELLQQCRLVVLILGELKAQVGLAWEIQKILELKAHEKTLLVVPPLSNRKIRPRWEALMTLTDGAIPSFEGNELAVAFTPDGSAIVLRGKGKRWERDYVRVLLPQAYQWTVRRNLTFRKAIYTMASYLFPIDMVAVPLYRMLVFGYLFLLHCLLLLLLMHFFP